MTRKQNSAKKTNWDSPSRDWEEAYPYLISLSSWREFCLALEERGLHGVELVTSDDHAGLRKAIAEVFTEAGWQRQFLQRRWVLKGNRLGRGLPKSQACLKRCLANSPSRIWFSGPICGPSKATMRHVGDSEWKNRDASLHRQDSVHALSRRPREFPGRSYGKPVTHGIHWKYGAAPVNGIFQRRWRLGTGT